MSFSKTNKVIGVMSGTSLDGIDLAYIEFDFDNKWKYRLGVCETIPYNRVWKNELKDLNHKTKEYIDEVDNKYTSLLAEALNSFITRNNLNVDAICSHGHTILHQPHKGITLQIGNGKLLLKATGIDVVSDFRTLDVKLGGQGAPLVPIGDELLFSEYDYCLNLGGFSNFSYSKDRKRIAFDICPVNMALNHFANLLGKEYDKNGSIAEKGVVNSDLLTSLNEIRYYSKASPKSLGKEWFEKEFLPLIKPYNDSKENILRTLTEHISIQIAKVIKEGNCLVTGGGAFNSFLMKRITANSKCKFILPNKNLINYKEALIFGLLGVLKIKGKINCLASVTGAKRNSIVGEYFT